MIAGRASHALAFFSGFVEDVAEWAGVVVAAYSFADSFIL